MEIYQMDAFTQKAFKGSPAKADIIGEVKPA